MNEENDQIVRADRIHRHIHNVVPPYLRKAESIILRRPSQFPTRHDLRFPDQTEEDKASQRDLLRWFEEHGKGKYSDPRPLRPIDIPKYSSARDLTESGFLHYKKYDKVFACYQRYCEDREVNETWTASPHHDSLFKLIGLGKVPRDTGSELFHRPRTLDKAWSRAAQHAHEIPLQFMTGKGLGYGEQEAFYAADYIFHSGCIESLCLQRSGWRYRLCSLVSNFPVPNPDRREGPPFLIDQLWVILEPGPSVRLLAIEVDDESHLDPEREKRDRKRDEILTTLGYDVWRVGGWWCRVDAWRVIAKVLADAFLLPDEESLMKESSLTDIESYVCEYCGKPMIRYDRCWIRQWRENEHDDLHKAHECCFELE